jgi:hypothetical protein
LLRSGVEKGSKHAPPDPGIIPGGIRDCALQAMLRRDPQRDKEKPARSQVYRVKVRAAPVARGGVPPAPPQRPTEPGAESDDERRRDAWEEAGRLLR